MATLPTATPPGARSWAEDTDLSEAVSLRESLALVEAFRSAYERKDLTGVMTLLGLSPREQSITGRAAVEQLYARNFARLDAIRYELSHLEVAAPKAQGDIRIQGRFRIRGVQRGSPHEPLDVEGQIRWTLSQEAGALRIVAIDYDMNSP